MYHDELQFFGNSKYILAKKKKDYSFLPFVLYFCFTSALLYTYISITILTSYEISDTIL